MSHCLLPQLASPVFERWSRIFSNKDFSLNTALKHMSWVFKQSDVNLQDHESSSMAWTHVSIVLRWSGISFIQFGTDAYKNLFSDTLQPSTSIDIWTIELAGHKQPLLKFCILILDIKFWWKAYVITFIVLILKTLLLTTI